MISRTVSSILLCAASATMVFGQGYGARPYDDPDRPREGQWNRAGTLAPGTEIVVRTIDRVEVRRADPNQRFMATVDRDVVDETGRVVIPRGSSAHLIATDIGHGEIAIDLRLVFVDGKRFVLNTEDISSGDRREGVGANRRTGEVVGGSALFGTIVGAIAGGGKGAAIGALAGGAAGASAEMMTRGNELRVPPEAILRFRLDHPVYLFQ